MAQAVGTRVGGHVVAESLEALGAEVAFGLPGVHALAIWEGLRTSGVRSVGLRTELNAGFAADGYARTSGRPAPLLLSTGPGALNSLTSLMEAASAHVPVVAIASQIPRDLVGSRRGYLHELRDQLASFAPVVKWAARASSVGVVPELLAEGWRQALAPPSGPVFLEIPVDLLTAETNLARVGELDGEPARPPLPPTHALDAAAALLAAAERPVVWAGGGVLRAGAWRELAALSERLDAPVATTYMGKGAFDENDPRAVGSACDERALQELLEEADVLLAVGTELGAETTGQYGLRLRGRLVQIDADATRIGSTYPALGLVGDATAVLAALLERVPPASSDGGGASRAAAVRARIERQLAGQGHDRERGLLGAIRRALPRDAVHAWDMTILAYWAAAHFPALTPRRFLYPLGSGTLGYAWPAALGAASALPTTPSLAVVGDGGFLYNIAELASARQYQLGGKLLLVDDGGYGILREYQREAYGETHAVDLVQPDFVALASAFGVPARATEPERLEDDLAWALAVEGPAVLVLRTVLEMWTPTD
ncbi:MAG: thiamine pyrophosphate-binding protein [Thermoleophilia bacterium]|nr:thiamine pyrophosphate-binding protein [Thermoleophilia bacterium]